MAEKKSPAKSEKRTPKNPKYKFIKGVTAELTFEAYGRDLNEVFKNAALATMDTMVDTKTVQPKLQKIIKLQSNDIKALLVDFLNELVYYKDAEQMFLSEFDVEIKQKPESGVWLLTAEISGEPLNQKRHPLRADVKAATWHML